MMLDNLRCAICPGLLLFVVVWLGAWLRIEMEKQP